MKSTGMPADYEWKLLECEWIVSILNSFHLLCARINNVWELFWKGIKLHKRLTHNLVVLKREAYACVFYWFKIFIIFKYIWLLCTFHVYWEFLCFILNFLPVEWFPGVRVTSGSFLFLFKQFYLFTFDLLMWFVYLFF